MTDQTPGVIVLLGSGETLPSSGKAHEFAARRLPHDPTIAILETPAGFELNAGQVAGKITEFLHTRLTNYNPNIIQIPARKRGTDLSPDDPDLVAPLLEADEILLGPGSPTYAVRQLEDSLAYGYLQARHRLGAALVLSSAATLAFGRHTIPVYEIFKVGEDLHWKSGLDFFGQFGLPLSIVPHWNNNDGGDDLDTSRCYIGKSRFDQLYQRLSSGETVLGIDDHTSVALDLAVGCCHVMGNGAVTVLRNGEERIIRSGDEFVLSQLGDFRLPAAGAGIPPEIWETAQRAAEDRQSRRQAAEQPPEDVLELVSDRTSAREAKEWDRADELRERIEAHGWTVEDTPEGPKVLPLDQ
jgi:hypothetical protein